MDWFYTSQGLQQGPVTEIELKAMLRAGSVLPTDLVWRDGLEDWIPASEAPELWQQPTEGYIPLDRAQPRVSGMAIASLIMAILSIPTAIMCICISPVLSIAAIVLGFVARAQIRREPHLYSGSGVALAGIIVAFIGLALFLVVLVALFAYDLGNLEGLFEEIDQM